MRSPARSAPTAAAGRSPRPTRSRSFSLRIDLVAVELSRHLEHRGAKAKAAEETLRRFVLRRRHEDDAGSSLLRGEPKDFTEQLLANTVAPNALVDVDVMELRARVEKLVVASLLHLCISVGRNAL